MLRTRIIPTLLLKNDALVKTVQYRKPSYIGDPINTVRIFNELEVDELVFLDIEASQKGRQPNFKILREIANECFMPLAYGGGIDSFETAAKIFEIGFEKVVLNTVCFTPPDVLNQVARHFGNQAVVASVDVKKNFWGKYEVWMHALEKKTKKTPLEWCKELEHRGAGEILLTSIDNEGSWSGFDIELVRQVCEGVNIPVIAHGGAGNIEHIEKVVKDGKASAVALGSMVVYQQQGMGVLVNFPDERGLRKCLQEV